MHNTDNWHLIIKYQHFKQWDLGFMELAPKYSRHEVTGNIQLPDFY